MGALSLAATLIEWAQHEARGRLRTRLPSEVASALDGPQGDAVALRILLQIRMNVVAAILAADPIRSTRVEVTAGDVPHIRVMGAVPLEGYARQPERYGGDGAWVNTLASRPEEITGPLLAVVRATPGAMTLFDGLHRAAAWVRQVRVGRDYPIIVNAIETRQAAPMFELA